MAPIFLRIENQEDLDWLQNILSNSMQKLRNGDGSRLETSLENIIRLHESVNNPITSKEMQRQMKEEEKASKKDTPSAAEVYGGNCSEHPAYQAKRAPRTECKGCWNTYEKLNPLKFKKARADFEKKQRT